MELKSQTFFHFRTNNTESCFVLKVTYGREKPWRQPIFDREIWSHGPKNRFKRNILWVKLTCLNQVSLLGLFRLATKRGSSHDPRGGSPFPWYASVVVGKIPYKLPLLYFVA